MNNIVNIKIQWPVVVGGAGGAGIQSQVQILLRFV